MPSRTTLLRLATFAAVAITAAMLGCGGSSGDGGTNPPPACTPTSTTVCMTTSNTFNPTTIPVAKGTTVTWSNTTGTTHNVTFDAVAGAPAPSGDFASGARSAAFPTAGTFPYHCTIHGLSMSGTVVVQ